MNSTQLELMIKRSRSFKEDRAASHLILALNEELQDCKKAIKELSQLFEQMTDTLHNVLHINNEMKSQIENARNQFRNEDDGLAASTKMIGHD